MCIDQQQHCNADAAAVDNHCWGYQQEAIHKSAMDIFVHQKWLNLD